jgi:hypothetical protein
MLMACESGKPGGGGEEMSIDGNSIFDLSPAEKLQLVEDLWDYLAGTPDAIPIHDWQKEGQPPEKPRLGALLGRSQTEGPQPVWPLNSSLRRRPSWKVTVYCVFHTSRDAEKWRERLP